MIYFFIIVWTTIAAIAITYDFDKEILKIKKMVKQLERRIDDVVFNENKEMTNKEYLLSINVKLNNVYASKISESYYIPRLDCIGANWEIIIGGRIDFASFRFIGLPWSEESQSTEVKNWWLNKEGFFREDDRELLEITTSEEQLFGTENKHQNC